MGSNPTPGATLAAGQEMNDTPIERDPEFLRELGLMKKATFTAGVAALALELFLNFFDAASVWDAAILTPAWVVLLLLSLFIHDSATSSPWKGRLRVESEFRKSLLMVFGALLATLGGGMALGSLGGGVLRVTIDMGGGTALVGTGLYVASRYRW